MHRAARVRVFVPTYRRGSLLERALDSLRAQTLTDWVCEVHNDDPNDADPARVVARLDDPRITLVTHAKNLGPVATFNLFFAGTPEPYYSLLEDDNWWDPRFLTTLVNALEDHPEVTIAWSNQRVWEELKSGEWRDTGTTVHPTENGGPRLVSWGEPLQALGAHHANGAMLVRSSQGQSYRAGDVPFTGIESVRERLFPHPLLYVPEPLGYFAMTQSTSRSRDYLDWLPFQTALLATFVKHAGLDRNGRAALWAHYRATPMPPTSAFLCAGLGCAECRPFLREATVGEWYRMLRAAARHPGSWWRAVRVRTRYPQWWAQLDTSTAAQFSAHGRRAPRAAQPAA